MINITNKKIIIILTALLIVFLTPVFEVSAFESLYISSPPKDSDFDGLTDQAEIQRFYTDPSSSDTDRDGFIDGAEVLSGTDPNNSNDPKETLSEVDYQIYQQNYQNVVSLAQSEFTASWPWYTARSSGIIAYVLLFFLIVSGIGIKTGFMYKIASPDLSWSIHRNISIIMTISIIIHFVSLLFDEYIKFTVLDVLSPFTPKIGGIYLSIGIISFYIIVSAIVTSLIYQQKYPRFWQIVHYLPYPVFILVLLHGLVLGSDSSTIIMQFIYWSTGIIFILLFVYRVFLSSRWQNKLVTIR